MITNLALARLYLSALRRSLAYDALMRLPVLIWAVGLALALVLDFQKYRYTASLETEDLTYLLNLAMRLSVIAYLLILTTTVAVRRAPLRRARGVEPRITALCGSFLITAVVLFPRRELSAAASCVSTLLVLLGDVIAIVVLIQLRRSFSIMAEARRLITSGTYRIIRHPLYLAEEVITIGSVIQYLSIWTSILLLVQVACQVRRMINEERVLIDVFPEYKSYQRTTARIIPKLY
jgi:protein-S-isoprenylcysteine O-methyltransferase Ste14